MTRLHRDTCACEWIERYCVNHDRPVFLSTSERAILHDVYGKQGISTPITGRLAAYVALLHLVGPEHGVEPPPLETDIFSLWAAAGTHLRWFIRREGETIVCRELGTRYPRAA
jgi:hypothetical protein